MSHLEPSKVLTPNPASLTPTANDGVDLLWKFQLRKENAAILEKQETNCRLIDIMAAENIKTKQDLGARLAALETTVSKLQSDEKKDRYTIGKWAEEVASLKSEMGVIMERLEKQLSAQNSVMLTNATSVNILSTPIPASDQSNIPNVTAGFQITGQPTSVRTSSAILSTPMQVPNSKTMLQTTHPSATDNRGRTTRSGSQSFAAVPIDNARLPPPQPIKIPRLAQSSSSLKTYLANASKVFAALSNDQKIEIEFIALFIKGIRDASTRETLIGELQQKHMSRTKKDGKVEILCKWEDVGEGLRRAGLVPIGGVNGVILEPTRRNI